MEEDKRNPSSRSPSPWPSWMEGQALSGQWEGAVCGSDLSLPPNWDEPCQEEVSKGQVRSYQELLTCREASIAQEFSQEDDSIGEDFFSWGDYRPSMLPQWEDDSNMGHAVEDWEYRTVHHIEVRPVSPEEDKWEELSVLELSQGEGREERLRRAEAEGFCVPAPREAWAERRAPEPCPAVPGCACPAQLAAQSPRGAAACAALEEQGAEAGTRSQGPAPQSPCCPPSPSHAPMVPSQKRPSLVRRALRALHRLFRSCLAGQPQD